MRIKYTGNIFKFGLWLIKLFCFGGGYLRSGLASFLLNVPQDLAGLNLQTSPKGSELEFRQLCCFKARWTPPPFSNSNYRDNTDYIRALLYPHHTTLTWWRVHQNTRDGFRNFLDGLEKYSVCGYLGPNGSSGF